MLLHGKYERRIIRMVGAALTFCISLAAVIMTTSPFSDRPADTISITIDTPYVGQGVTDGTPAVMHGVEVGQVGTVSSLAAGGARLTLDLQSTPVAELTDTMSIDFRPVNYFGITGINLIADTGGEPLRDGSQINAVPKGNFTMQALLSRLGEVSTGALTPQLIEVIDRATRYTDALNPLIETALIAGDAVAQVQTIDTAQLLRNATGLSVVFPSTVEGLMRTGDDFLNNDENFNQHGSRHATSEEWENLYIASLEEASVNLFGAIGRLESSHVDNLLPMIDGLTALTDVVPPLLRPEGFAQTLSELRSRFEKMYAGSPDQRALQVQIILDNFPGVAAPLGMAGRPG